MNPDRLAIICAALPALIARGEIGDVCVAATKKLADELAGEPEPLPPVMVSSDDPTLRMLFAYFFAAEAMSDPLTVNSPTKFDTARAQWTRSRDQLRTHLERLKVSPRPGDRWGHHGR